MIDEVNKYFDHAMLNPDATLGDIRRACREADEYDVYGIAVNPFWVKDAKKELEKSEVKIISVAGFPLSAMRTDLKVAEAVKGVEDGADEIDMVANVGLLVMGEYKKVEKEIAKVRKELPKKVILKAIIECPCLKEENQIEAVKAVMAGGAQFVKTSTGFFGPATLDMVHRLVDTAEEKIKVKASGGIKTLSDAEAMIRAGANRLGSSSAAVILEEFKTLGKRKFV